MKSIKLSNSTKHILVDDEDFYRVSKHNWQLSKDHVASRIAGDTVSIGRFILRLKKGDGILAEHQDRNIFNNQRYNLRRSTISQNAANRAIKPRLDCPYKGVYESRGKWRARIRVNRIIIGLGTYQTQILAAKAYNKAVKKHFGEFAVLNQLNEKVEEKLAEDSLGHLGLL